MDGEKREFEGGKERNLELISLRFEFTGPSLHAINFMVGILHCCLWPVQTINFLLRRSKWEAKLTVPGNYLLLMSVFHTLTEPSAEAEIVLAPPVVMTTALTAAVWPFITCTHSAEGTYHNLVGTGWGGDGMGGTHTCISMSM